VRTQAVVERCRGGLIVGFGSGFSYGPIPIGLVAILTTPFTAAVVIVMYGSSAGIAISLKGRDWRSLNRLPADRAWRRGSGIARVGTVALNVAGVVAIIYAFGKLGLNRGGADILAVIAGIILGGLAGNALASRTWGRAHTPVESAPSRCVLTPEPPPALSEKLGQRMESGQRGLPARRGQYGVAPAKSLAMVAVMPRTTVGAVVMSPAFRSSLVIAVVKLLLPAYTVVSLTDIALAWM
jgi:hypothetical protein